MKSECSVCGCRKGHNQGCFVLLDRNCEWTHEAGAPKRCSACRQLEPTKYRGAKRRQWQYGLQAGRCAVDPSACETSAEVHGWLRGWEQHNIKQRSKAAEALLSATLRSKPRKRRAAK